MQIWLLYDICHNSQELAKWNMEVSKAKPELGLGYIELV